MRHKGVSKEETRKKMIEAVGRGFRGKGYNGIGVDKLAKEAGVTSGAFYAHFGSKAGAFDIALAVGLDEVIVGIPNFQRKHGHGWVKAFADYYLGQPHRDNTDSGCAMALMTPDVIRAGPAVHEAFEQKMDEIVRLSANGLAGGSEDERRARAWGMLTTLIGGVNVARAMALPHIAEEVSKAVKTAAIAIAGPTISHKEPSP